MRGRVAAVAAMSLLTPVSCGGDEDLASPATTTEHHSAAVADAAQLIGTVEDLLGPCTTVDTTLRDGRSVETCTIGNGPMIEVDVWTDAEMNAPHHLYRSAQVAWSTECLGASAGVFAGWLAGGNWMISSTDSDALDSLHGELGGVVLARPDCAEPTCDGDVPWTQIHLRHSADGFVPPTVEQRADGAELCVTSESDGVIGVMLVALPEDYDTSDVRSSIVTQRQVDRIATVMHGVSGESPVSWWLDPGHHLVLIEHPGLMTTAWNAAAIQLRPDVGPMPSYPTLPGVDVVPDAAPLRFLLVGGEIVDGEQDDRSGEFTLASGESEVSLFWTTLDREPFAEFVDDRRDSGTELAPAVVAGFDAVVVVEDSTSHAALIHDASYLYEFRADMTELDFRTLLGDVVVVSEPEWTAAYASELVAPDDLATVVAGMLEGVTLPDTIDPDSFDDLDVSGSGYQVGAAVVDRVVCAWLNIWESSPVGSQRHDEAIDALADAAGWPILVEMEREGGFTDVIREVGRAVRAEADSQSAFAYLSTCDL